MMEDPKPEQNGQEYDLKASTKRIGQLYPVLKAADGEVIDGVHRIESDPSWKALVLENINTPEDKIIARLVANFHRRTVPTEEKAQWINQLAQIYRNNGLKVEGTRERAQGPNEIAEKICEVTGMSRESVMLYLRPCFKQQSHRCLDPKQHHSYKDPEEVIFNQLSHWNGGKPSRIRWAREVIERFKEEHEKELLKSPLFRKKILDKIKGKTKYLNPAIPNAPSNDKQIQELLNLNEKDFFPEPKPGGRWETQAEKEARHKREAHEGFEQLPNLYETFIQECPGCICSKCPHANECIERVRPGD